MVPNATEDHFMPCVGIDDMGNPFAGVKLGNNPATVYEGILRSPDGGATWFDAVNASANADGNALECCPSLPFWAEGRYYDLVRNNNNNCVISAQEFRRRRGLGRRHRRGSVGLDDQQLPGKRPKRHGTCRRQ